MYQDAAKSLTYSKLLTLVNKLTVLNATSLRSWSCPGKRPFGTGLEHFDERDI